jgi:hypothetical protein
VDIQPIAIQIAKLRFFISLVVEQEIKREAKNLGILALPNLETRLIAADTLSRLNRQQQRLTLRSPKVEELIKKLAQVRAKYLTARTPATKQKYREEDKKLRAEMIECLKTDRWDDRTAHLLANWDPYDQNASASFFDPEWMFALSTGFDTVLGNPPYIQLQKSYDPNSIYADLYKDQNRKNYADLYKDQKYKTFAPRGDIYCLFYERGVELLREGGLLAYITSNKWMRADYGEKLREYFATHTNPLLLIDLGPGVFKSATVDTNILLLQRAPNQNRLRAFTYTDPKQSLRDAMQTRAQHILIRHLSKGIWFIGSEAEYHLKEKIERIGMPLHKWRKCNVKIYRGISTGLNKAFIIDTETRQRILDACKDDAERQRTEALIKPILRGRDIKRYTYEWKGLWVILIPAGWTDDRRGSKPAEKYIKRVLPSLMKHLRRFEAKARARKDQGDYWWELRPCAYYAEFEKEKVVWQELAQGSQFAFDGKGRFFVSNTAYIMTGTHLRYLPGYLNSRLNEITYSRWYCTKLGSSGTRWLNQHVLSIPVPPITPQNRSLVRWIELLVNRILARRRGNPPADTRDLERKIDEQVYRLYDLTPDEIRLIEGK